VSRPPHALSVDFSLEAPAAGKLRAHGPLTFATARGARLAGLAALAGAAGQPAVVMDCAGITSADSAGLSVLIDWLAAAKAAGHALRYTGLPAGFAALARISNLQELLERGV
jgi:phospholipid transport system transporter-binding protein